MLKTCGPIKVSDSRLSDALLLLPEDESQFIARSGGLEKFLLKSPLFVAHGDLICLTEDAPVIRDSISQSSSATSSNSSLGTDLTNSQKNTTKVQVPDVASDMHVGSQSVSKNSNSGSKNMPTSTDRQPSLSSLVDTHQQDTLSGGLKFDSDAKLNPTKTYGVELGSGLNSPSTSPLDSPRMMSPTDHVNLNSVNSGSTGSTAANGKQHKLGAMAHGLAKRPDSAGEKRERESIPPRDVTSSSSRGQQQNTKMSSSSSSSSGGSSRAVGHERQQKREQPQQLRQLTNRRENRDSGREEGGEKLSSSSSERLLSTASDSSGGLGILGEFFSHATASSGGTGSTTGSMSGSGSGSQGDDQPPTPPATTTTTTTTALANSKLFRAAMSGATTTNTEEQKGPTKTTTLTSISTRDMSVQTAALKIGLKLVQTDPLPSVESFKERYEKVLKEKKDLQVKLERSEDQKFKMQRDHKRELDKLEKKYYTEARKVCPHVVM